MTEVISTFSKDGYDLYGKSMIDSWLKFWPDDYTLTIYTEGYDIPNRDNRINTIDLNTACPDLDVFKSQSIEQLKDNDKKHNNRIKKTVKWCHKVYAMSHALKRSTQDFLVFLDGDTRTLKPIQKSLASKLVHDNLFAVHFEYLKNGLHFETGLVVFNLKHNMIPWLSDEMIKPYNNLDIYNMDKTWDGFLFAKLYTEYNLPVKNLSEGYTGVFCNPLINSFIVHDVGPKKYKGTSYDRYSGKRK
jgi:hypothetical protein